MPEQLLNRLQGVSVASILCTANVRIGDLEVVLHVVRYFDSRSSSCCGQLDHNVHRSALLTSCEVSKIIGQICANTETSLDSSLCGKTVQLDAFGCVQTVAKNDCFGCRINSTRSIVLYYALSESLWVTTIVSYSCILSSQFNTEIIQERVCAEGVCQRYSQSIPKALSPPSQSISVRVHIII